jgi:hypothetical protein
MKWHSGNGHPFPPDITKQLCKAIGVL